MKRFGVIAAIALAACATAPRPVTKPAATPAAVLEDHAGDSVETAVEVPADAPKDGFDFENDWIWRRYGKFRRRGGGTGTLNGRRYDVVDVELWGGDKKKVFFDITDNWKHWQPPAK